MCAPGTLRAILDGAGFQRIEERELRYQWHVKDPRDYVATKLKRSFAPLVEGLSDDRFDALMRAVMDAWAPFAEDGILLVPNTARLGIGWKPA